MTTLPISQETFPQLGLSNWMNRPDEEIFDSLDSMWHSAMDLEARSRETNAFYGQMAVESEETELTGQYDPRTPEGRAQQTPLWLTTPDYDGGLRVTFGAFNQLCRLIGAPSKYLRSLPTWKAADLLNFGLDLRGSGEAKLLVAREADTPDGFYALRAVTTDAYTRMWNTRLLDLLRHLPDYWRTPPARPAPGLDPARARRATEMDVLRGQRIALSVKVGDLIGPAGLYMSPDDLFVFLVDDEHPIEVNGQLYFRGVFIWGGDTGWRSVGIDLFLWASVCGNHIVHGGKMLGRLRMAHVGDMSLALEKIQRQLDAAMGLDVRFQSQRMIEGAQKKRLGDNKDEVVEVALVKTRGAIPIRTLNAAYDHAEERGIYGDPRTVWGMVSGLTEKSQELTHMADRIQIDVAAGKLLSLVS